MRAVRVLTVGNLYPPAAEGGYERTWRAVVRELDSVRVLTTAPVPGAAPPPGAADPPEVFRELAWYWDDHRFVRPRLRARLRLERRNAAVLRAHVAAFRPDAVCWWGMGGMSLSLIEQCRRAGVPAAGAVGDEWMGYGRRADAWTAGWRRLPAALAAPVERAAGVPARVDIGAAAHWTFASQWLRRRSLAQVPLPETSVVSPGVDPGQFPPQPPREFGWRLACIGRVEPVKGVATAIEALARLPAEATLTVRGDGPAAHRADLEALATRLGVRSRVRFEAARTGPVLGAYAAADVVLFPVTWDEPWGLVPLEAMSVERPVVATGTGGSAEYLRDGENCLRFPRRDAGALAAAVRRLAEDAALRDRLVARGRATAAEYTEAAFVAGVIAALEARAAR